jgi:hypothetical protein
MKKESLVKARELVFRIINDSSIDTLDKYELLLNLYNLLDPFTYEDSIKVLEKYRRNR